jgi:asparagine synthase (glutamine-hydrolysing)
MCRIAGITSNKLQLNEIRAKVIAMGNSLKHGGPDDVGLFLDEKVKLAFGHRRLSIIDLSKNGHQPMADAGQRAWITFNGEIYNYPELKEQLLKTGAKFNSGTDTEVILAAYLQWGTSAFQKLRGMFAFALYDVSQSVTYLVRDTTGIKPLYYHVNDGELSFASEIKAFKAAGIAKQPDETWQIRFLALGNIPEPYTTLKNVFSLAKGHFLAWQHKSGTYNISTYCDQPSGIDYITDVNAAKQAIHDSLTGAIKRELISDAPIGVFLSGGIDSSLS